jgi:DNA-binding CsgD family transcriptional regulator
MSILQRLLYWLGLRPRSDPRYYEISESLHVTLSTIAKQEGRPEQELIPDLVAAGLDQYRSNDKFWPKWESLSQREKEVAAFTCLGLTNRQIAARLSLSPETVKSHIRSVLVKFGLNSKDELRRILAGWDFSGWL